VLQDGGTLFFEASFSHAGTTIIASASRDDEGCMCSRHGSDTILRRHLFVGHTAEQEASSLRQVEIIVTTARREDESEQAVLYSPSTTS